jgi:uncharacterized protein (TIGR00255 family)
MTGYARVRRALEPANPARGELSLSIKSVNHRGLDLHIQGPSAVDSLESVIRSLVKSKVQRGHVEIRVSLPSQHSSGQPNGQPGDANAPVLAVNERYLKQYLRLFREQAAQNGLPSEPDLNVALRIPGMLQEAEAPEPTGLDDVLKDALVEALDELNTFRDREGAAIAQEMRLHNDHIASVALQLEQLREGAAAGFQARLADRLADLLRGAQLDPQRLAHEAAILADRSDIGEELARLKIHSAQLSALLDQGGELGKKIEFLLQEMNRETNTVLSKTNGAGDASLKITELALSAKAAIEKVREQSLNLE